MRLQLLGVFAAAALFVTVASCSSDSPGCNVVGGCVAECETQCAPDPVASIACVGNACNCVCGMGGAGGMGGMSGAGGMAGAGGMGGMSGAGGQ